MTYIRTEKGLEEMTEEQYEKYIASLKTEEQVKQEKILELRQKLRDGDHTRNKYVRQKFLLANNQEVAYPMSEEDYLAFEIECEKIRMELKELEE